MRSLNSKMNIMIQVDSQQTNTDSERFKACMEALQQKDEVLIDMLLEEVENYNEEHVGYNCVIDLLKSEIEETKKLMEAGGFEKECLDAYSNCRREYLFKCLSKLLGSQDLNEGEKCCKAFNVVLRIIYPSERRLFPRVSSDSSAADRCFADVWRGATFRLLQSAKETVRPSAPTLLFGILDVFATLLIPESTKSLSSSHSYFKSSFMDEKGNSSLNILRKKMADRPERWELRVPISIFTGFANTIFRSPETNIFVPADGGVHEITLDAVDYLDYACQSHQKLDVDDRERLSSSLSAQMVWITELLKEKLEAISRSYEDPALRYVFMMNNMRRIEQQVKEGYQLIMLLSDDWFRQNTDVQRYLELYRDSSWKEVLNLLKLDGNDVAAESMKKTFKSFNSRIGEIYTVQSTWLVSDEQLRLEIITSLENILLPAYGLFVGRFFEVVGNQVEPFFKLGINDIPVLLKDLFRGKQGMNQ